MKTQNTCQQFPNNLDHSYKQQSAGGKTEMIDAVLDVISKLLSLDLIKESRAMRRRTGENIEATNRMLNLDGEDQWMLKACRTDKNGAEECLPNDKI